MIASVSFKRDKSEARSVPSVTPSEVSTEVGGGKRGSWEIFSAVYGISTLVVTDGLYVTTSPCSSPAVEVGFKKTWGLSVIVSTLRESLSASVIVSISKGNRPEPFSSVSKLKYMNNIHLSVPNQLAPVIKHTLLWINKDKTIK